MAFFRISKKKIISGINDNILDARMELDEYIHEAPEHPEKLAIMDMMKKRIIDLIQLKKDVDRLITS